MKRKICSWPFGSLLGILLVVRTVHVHTKSLRWIQQQQQQQEEQDEHHHDSSFAQINFLDSGTNRHNKIRSTNETLLTGKSLLTRVADRSTVVTTLDDHEQQTTRTTTKDKVTLEWSPVCYPLYAYYKDNTSNISIDNANTTASFQKDGWNAQQAKSKITRVVMYHMRKAGGTTIVSYFDELCKHYNLTCERLEGTPAESPTRPDTLYVTFVRDPVERTLSHYKYSFRWPDEDIVHWWQALKAKRNKQRKREREQRQQQRQQQQQQVEHSNNRTNSASSPQQLTSTNSTDNDDNSFIPTIENSRTIEEFIATDIHRARVCHRRDFLWTCSVNCYTRWFSNPHDMCNETNYYDYHSSNTNGVSRDSGEKTVFDENLQRVYQAARTKLFHYDLIIDSNRLFHDADYGRQIETFFGFQGLVGLDRHAPFGKAAKHANELNPIHYNSTILQEIRRRNALDIRLVRDLLQCSFTENKNDSHNHKNDKSTNGNSYKNNNTITTANMIQFPPKPFVSYLA